MDDVTADGSEKAGYTVLGGLAMTKIDDGEVTAMCVIDDGDYESI